MNVKELREKLEEFDEDMPVLLDVKGVTSSLQQVDYEYSGGNGNAWVLLNDYHPHDYRKNRAGLD